LPSALKSQISMRESSRLSVSSNRRTGGRKSRSSIENRQHGAFGFNPLNSKREKQNITRCCERLSLRFDAKRDIQRILWEAGQTDRSTYRSQQSALNLEEHEARLKAINDIYRAQMEDLAQMPRSTFVAMDEAAERYLLWLDRI
jgi:hypothetical protein